MGMHWPRIAIVESDDTEALFACLEALDDALMEGHGFSCTIAVEGSALVLPPPHEVWVDGRTLRGDEYETYVSTCRGVLASLGVQRVREHFERIVPLDWDRFDPAIWAKFHEACARVDGWVGTPGELARWFGHDEQLGPALWGSIEPPGFLVVALVEPARFEAWWQSFLEETSSLPQRGG